MQLSLFDSIPLIQSEFQKGIQVDKNKKLLVDLYQAYFDARSNKRNTINQLQFEINYESNLIQLVQEINERKYQLKPSICFIINDPVQREIFAADFRDRVVHHLIYNYISPIFERVFINDAYSCRKGKGTSYGINRLQYFILSCSENYTKDCYVLKLDIKGYFMAINKQILFEKVEITLEKFRYKTKEKETTWNEAFDYETLMYLIEKVLFNNPKDGCTVKGKKTDWNGLPPSKSLFQSPAGCGLPIGNLTSQLFSNIFLNEFDRHIKCELKCKYYGRYVDDFVIVHNDREYLKSLIPILTNFLLINLQLVLHPKKIYLQNINKGVKFLGTIIKPHRTYIGNRTKGNLYKTIKQWNKIAENQPNNELEYEQLQQFISTINSYLGCMKHYDTYKLRKEIICKNLSTHLWKQVSLCNREKMVIKKKYSTNRLTMTKLLTYA
jgi:hypothetical protein